MTTNIDLLVNVFNKIKPTLAETKSALFQSAMSRLKEKMLISKELGVSLKSIYNWSKNTEPDLKLNKVTDLLGDICSNDTTRLKLYTWIYGDSTVSFIGFSIEDARSKFLKHFPESDLYLNVPQVEYLPDGFVNVLSIGVKK